VILSTTHKGVDILNEIRQLSSTFIFAWGLTSGEEVEGGESLHRHSLNIDLIGSAVHLGDHHLIVRAVVGSKFIIGRSELLAVTTPGGIELHEDILVALEYQVYNTVRQVNECVR
jgi:hypothetical protein